MTWSTPNLDVPPFAPHPSTIGSGGTVEPDVSTLGHLADLLGKWSGTGMNAIWTPSQQSVTGSPHFLQLATTVDTFSFDALDGSIPNRGLNQPDLFMAGIQYANNISSNGKALHFETGIWLAVPATTDPPLDATVARMASIPHGTTITAQGSVEHFEGPPVIGTANLTPFTIGNPSAPQPFPELDLGSPTAFRTPDAAAQGFTQGVINDMNTVLTAALPPNVTSTTSISVSTVRPNTPGGGQSNTAFLIPNATTSLVTQNIWLLRVAQEATPSLLLYTQTVELDFNTLTWPHVTVGILKRA